MAEILWKWSSIYKLRYKTLISDGDSKVFSHLQNLKVYDSEIELEKVECIIIHVSKWLGTALRNNVKVCKAQINTLGGKSFGSLKNSTISEWNYETIIMHFHYMMSIFQLLKAWYS